ncbi:hypothetical protein BH11MYX1_BH11MYX1_19870 [soil metagenome]
MVARSATATAGFVPAQTPRIAIASDGTMAAIHEPSRITVLALPDCSAIAEVGVDPEAGSSEVAWVGSPPRLAVLSRYAAHSTVHLLDPHGPRTIAEIRLEAPMRLMASVGAHALAVGALGAAVLTAGDAHLTPYQFPARTVPTRAGAAAGQFVVGLPGSIEEWDPQLRMPKRRLKLPKPANITALGGSDRVVWMTTQQDPTRLDVFALVNRGQPKFHELPEPIGYVASHPRSDLLACIGADSGRLFGVDLDGKTPLRIIALDGIDRVEAAGLVLGRMTAVLAAQARRPVVLVSLDGREIEASVSVPASLALAVDPLEPTSSLYGDDLPELAASVLLQGTPVMEPSHAPPVVQLAPEPRAPGAASATSVPRAPMQSVAPAVSLADRFTSWRASTTSRAAATRPIEATASTASNWRDELATWTRSVLTTTTDRQPPSIAAIELLANRMMVAPQLYAGLALLYGAHLCGEAGVAPVDVARVLARNWDEALGRGQLAHTRVATFRDSRVRLASFAQRALDQLHPATGTIVGTPGPIELLTACVVVASDRRPLGLVAEATLPLAGGAILVADPDVDPVELVLEARAHGAFAMVRAAGITDRIPSDTTIIFVAADEAHADQLELPRLN